MALSFNYRLKNICKEKSNSLCIGLDIDPDKFPLGRDISLDGMENFGKEVIKGDAKPMLIYSDKRSKTGTGS